MITALDSNVLFDLLIPGAPHADASRRALVEAAEGGELIICEMVYAELAPHFRSSTDLDGFLSDTEIRLLPCSRESLRAAGQAWREYLQQRGTGFVCQSCGARQDFPCSNCGSAIRIRQHLLADFLIGAHAQHQSDRLLTRDRGYFAVYFPGLTLA